MNEEIIEEYYQIIKKQISQNELEKAKDTINILIENFPQDSMTYYLEGICNFALKNYEGAIASYKHSLTLNNKNAKAYFNLGVCYQILKDFDEALINIAKALIIFSNQENLKGRTKCFDALKVIESERKGG